MPARAAPVACIAVALCGCSINLGALTPSSDKEEPARLVSPSNTVALSEAIKADPNNPQAYNARGAVLAQAGKTEDALADFNKAISLDPTYAPAYANRGQAYRQSRRPDQAMADYERAIALDANSAAAYLGRGLVRKERNQPQEALEDFNKAIALSPDSAEAHYNRGLLYQGEKQDQLAVEDFTAANGLVPQQAEPLVARALSYLALDKAREAAADLDEAVQASPQNAQAWITRDSHMNASATRPGPSVHMPAPSVSVPATRPPGADLPALAASPAPELRYVLTPNQFPACSERGRVRRRASLFRQNRVEHGFCRRQHVLGNRLSSSLGMQVERPRGRGRNIRGRGRPQPIVETNRTSVRWIQRYGRVGRARPRDRHGNRRRQWPDRRRDGHNAARGFLGPRRLRWRARTPAARVPSLLPEAARSRSIAARASSAASRCSSGMAAVSTGGDAAAAGAGTATGAVFATAFSRVNGIRRTSGATAAASAGFSDTLSAGLPEIAFSEIPFALTPGSGRLLTSEASAGFASDLGSVLGWSLRRP